MMLGAPMPLTRVERDLAGEFNLLRIASIAPGQAR